MQKKKRLVINIGYPKTGTTALQRDVYPNVPGFKFLGKFDGQNKHFTDSALEQVLSDIMTLSDSVFFKKFSNHKIDFPEKSFISEELLSFDLFRPKDKSSTTSHRKVAERLQFVFSENGYEMTVFFVVREQVEMIKSIYAQSYASYFIHEESLNRFDKFLAFFTTNENNSLKDLLDYEKTYLVYSEVFGVDNVKCFFYEDFKSKSDDFLFKLSEEVFDGVEMKNIKLGKHNNRDFKNGKLVDGFTLSNLLGGIKRKIPGLKRVKPPLYLKKYLNKVVLNNNELISSSIIINQENKRLVERNFNESNKRLLKFKGSCKVR